MIVPTSELMQASDSGTTGDSVFRRLLGVDTFLAWCNMSCHERRVLATNLARYDAPGANEFADMIIDAIFLAPAQMDDDAEYYRKLRAAIDDPDFFDTTWTDGPASVRPKRVPGSERHNEEDYFGQPLPVVAQQDGQG